MAPDDMTKACLTATHDGSLSFPAMTALARCRWAEGDPLAVGMVNDHDSACPRRSSPHAQCSVKQVPQSASIPARSASVTRGAA